MIGFLVVIVLICFVFYMGWLFERVNKEKISYKEEKDKFILYYSNRVIIINRNNRTQLYYHQWVNKTETVIIPTGNGSKSIKQAEQFIVNYKTSNLLTRLFNFSHPLNHSFIMEYDFPNAKELIEIQMKIKAFIRTN